MVVYVLDQAGKPLMPTRRLGKVRHWLKEGRAVVVRREPFSIQLLEVAGGYTQPLTAGIDTGTGHVGASVVSRTAEVFSAEFILRRDIAERLTERRMYRRTRRGRKVRHRAARFNNRRRQDPLMPSVRAKVAESQKVFRLIGSLLPITTWQVEVGNFDPHKLVNPDVAGEGYQQGEQYGFYNTREYVLWRDGHTCQGCHGQRSEIRNTIPSAFGFKRGDRVRLADSRAGFIVGLRSAGYFDVRRLDGTVLHHSAKHTSLHRLESASTLRIERLQVKGVSASSPG